MEQRLATLEATIGQDPQKLVSQPSMMSMLLNYPPIICTSVSFSFHIWGHFFFQFFFGLPFCLIRGEGGGSFAISVETLNTFNIFWRAYQSSFTRGAYQTASGVLVAVGVTRWKLATTEADRLHK